MPHSQLYRVDLQEWLLDVKGDIDLIGDDAADQRRIVDIVGECCARRIALT